MTKSIFAPGTRIELDGKTAVIGSEKEESCCIFFKGGTSREIPKKVMDLAFNEGRLVFPIDTPESKLAQTPYLSSSEARQAQRFLAYLRPMAQCDKPGSKEARKAIIDEIVKSRGEEVLPAPAENTLYKWFIKWNKAGQNIFALLPHSKAQQRRSRIAPEVLDLMNDEIDTSVLQGKPSSTLKAYRRFRDKAKALNLGEKIPSRQTFYNHVNAIHPLERVKKQHGNAAYQEAKRTITGHYNALYPLERVEIDAVHLTINLINEHLETIANTVIVYIALDIYSRAVVGFAYKYGFNISEDAEGVIDCFSSILRKKNIDYPHLKNEWFGGKPSVIVADPSSAIVSNSFTEMAGIYGVSREITESSQGWKKPHIESFFRTLRLDIIDETPGASPKRSHEFKSKKKPEEPGRLLPEQFERALVEYLVDRYNQFSHSAIGGMTPHQKWLEGVEKFGQPEMVDDLSFANLFGGLTKVVTIHEVEGINLNYQTYHSKDLTELFYRLEPPKKGQKKKVKIRYSSQDLTKIAVLDETTRTYLVVPATKPIPEGMTLRKVQAIEKAKREKDNRPGVIIADSAELVCDQERLKAIEEKTTKRSRKHPETTPAGYVSEEELSKLFPEHQEADIPPNNSAREESAKPIVPAPDVTPWKGQKAFVRGRDK